MKKCYLVFEKGRRVWGPYDSYLEAEENLRSLGRHFINDPTIEEWDIKVAKALYPDLHKKCGFAWCAEPVGTISVNEPNPSINLPNSDWAGKWEYDGKELVLVPNHGVKIFRLPWTFKVFIYEPVEFQFVSKYAVVRQDGHSERWLHVAGDITNAIVLDNGQCQYWSTICLVKLQRNWITAL